MNITPLYPYVLVKPEEEKTGEVIIPDTAKSQPARGIIVREAQGISEVSVGDRIQWKELAGIYIDDFILVDLNDILLKF